MTGEEQRCLQRARSRARGSSRKAHPTARSPSTSAKGTSSTMSHMSTPSMVRAGGESEYYCEFIDSNLITPPKKHPYCLFLVLHDEVIAFLVVVVGEMDQEEKMVERQRRFLVMQS